MNENLKADLNDYFAKVSDYVDHLFDLYGEPYQDLTIVLEDNECDCELCDGEDTLPAEEAWGKLAFEAPVIETLDDFDNEARELFEDFMATILEAKECLLADMAVLAADSQEAELDAGTTAAIIASHSNRVAAALEEAFAV